MAKKSTKKARSIEAVRDLFDAVFVRGLEEIVDRLDPDDERFPGLDACLLSSDDLFQDPAFKELVAAKVDELIEMVQQYHDMAIDADD